MKKLAFSLTLQILLNSALPSHGGDLNNIEIILNSATDLCLSERAEPSYTYYFGNKKLTIKTSPDSALLKGNAIEEFCAKSALSRPPMEITVQPFDLLVHAEISKILFENGEKNDAAIGGLGNVIAAFTYAQESIEHGSFGCSALEIIALSVAHTQGEVIIGGLPSEDMRAYAAKTNTDLIQILLSEKEDENTCQ